MDNKLTKPTTFLGTRAKLALFLFADFIRDPETFSTTQNVILHFKQSVTTFAARTPLPPFNSNNQSANIRLIRKIRVRVDLLKTSEDREAQLLIAH